MQPAKGSSGFRRTALAVFAIACVGAGGGTPPPAAPAGMMPNPKMAPPGATHVRKDPGGGYLWTNNQGGVVKAVAANEYTK